MQSPRNCSGSALPVGARIEDHVEEALTRRRSSRSAAHPCRSPAVVGLDVVGHHELLRRPRVGRPRVATRLFRSRAGLCDDLLRAAVHGQLRGGRARGAARHRLVSGTSCAISPDDVLSFALPVARPELFDAPCSSIRFWPTSARDRRRQERALDVGIWAPFGAPGSRRCARARAPLVAQDRVDLLLGTLVNAYLASGARAVGIRSGRAAPTWGRSTSSREAVRLLHAEAEIEARPSPSGRPSRDRLERAAPRGRHLAPRTPRPRRSARSS